jgi:hypothetical protein
MMQNKYPQKPGIDFILKQAFFWNKTLVFQLMFSMIFLESSLPHFFFSEKDMEYWNRIRNQQKPLKGTKAYMEKISELSATENYQMFTLAIWATMAFLYP